MNGQSVIVGLEPTSEEIRVKILHILSIYPVISPTMLQSGLGASWRPIFWRPVLEALIKEGKVEEVKDSMMTPTDRYNTYTKLSLPGTVTYRRQAVG